VQRFPEFLDQAGLIQLEMEFRDADRSCAGKQARPLYNLEDQRNLATGESKALCLPKMMSNI
jgi:hypothetical protein